MDIIPQWCPIPLQDQTNHGHHSSVISYTFTGPGKSWTSFLSDVLYLYIITGPDKSWTSFLSDFLYLYRTRQIMDIIPQWFPIPLQDQTNHGHHSSVISYTFTGPDKSWTSFLSDVLYLYIITGPDKSWTSFLSDVLYLYRTRQIMDIIPQWFPIPLQDQTNHGHHSSVISYTFTGPDKSWTSFLSDVLYLYIITGPDKSWTSFLSDVLYLYRTRQIMDIIPQWFPIPLQDQTNHGHHSSVISYTFTGPDKSWTSFLSDVLYLYRTRQIMDIIPQWFPIPLQDQKNHGHHSSVMCYTFIGPDKSWTSFLSDVLYLYIITGPDKSWTSFLSDVLYLYMDLYRTRQIMDIIPQWCPIPLYNYRTRQIMDIIPQWCPIPLQDQTNHGHHSSVISYLYRTRQIMDIIPQWFPIPLQDQTNHGHHSSVMSYTFTGPDKSWTSFLSDVPIPLQDQTNHGHHSSVMSYTFTWPDKSWTSFLSDVLYLYRTRQIMDIIPQWCPIPLQDQINHGHHSSVISYTFTGPEKSWTSFLVMSYTFTGPDKSWTSFLSDVLYLYRTRQIMDIIP